jgi:hypothetical protein
VVKLKSIRKECQHSGGRQLCSYIGRHDAPYASENPEWPPQPPSP